MEPVPTPRGPGRVILLNGASSSGKSTLATGLQHALDEPFLYLSSDQLVDAGVLPERRDAEGPFRWWEELRPRFFAGFHGCIPALADAGNDLIVEHVIEFPAWRAELAQLLAHLDVDTTAGVTPALVTRVIASWRSRGADRALLREA